MGFSAVVRRNPFVQGLHRPILEKYIIRLSGIPISAGEYLVRRMRSPHYHGSSGPSPFSKLVAKFFEKLRFKSVAAKGVYKTTAVKCVTGGEERGHPG